MSQVPVSKGVAPDTIEITFSMSAHKLHYDEMMQKSEKQLRYMQQIMVAAGFDAKELRTTHYSIEIVEKTIKRKQEDDE